MLAVLLIEDGFAAAANETMPLPVPEADEGNVIQLALAVAVQAQLDGVAVTFRTARVAPVAGTFPVIGVTEYLQTSFTILVTNASEPPLNIGCAESEVVGKFSDSADPVK
jgi:hypothetical protein